MKGHYGSWILQVCTYWVLQQGLEPLEPFASSAFCILRIINSLTGTLRHSVCALEKHKIISCQGPSVTLWLCLAWTSCQISTWCCRGRRAWAASAGGTVMGALSSVMQMMWSVPWLWRWMKLLRSVFQAPNTPWNSVPFYGKIVWLIRYKNLACIQQE